jgi:dipeptidyl aminopeptidase/acylaminoacyl peptidase
MASDVATGRERQIAEGVSEFAASPGGAMLAVVQGSGRTGDIWLVRRDGSEPARQITSNTRAEGGLSWNNDGTQLTYSATEANLQRPLTRSDWAAWCGTSEVRLLNIDTAEETTFEPGCNPAFSPDGRRIAFATPPEQTGPAGQKTDLPNTANTIRLINSKGEHGWSFAVADGETPESGLLVYAPAWSPDGADLAYQRFLGYQALVDMNYTEIGGSFSGDGSLADVGSGWLLPPRFAPTGLHMAIVEHDAENARGWEGYEQWQVRILRRGKTREIPLPDGSHTATSSLVERLPRAAGVAWSPDSTTLAVLLPSGWQPDVSPNQPHFENTAPGEVWLWEPGRQPSRRIIENIDYASPLLWLPAIDNKRDNNQDNNRANQQANTQGNNQGVIVQAVCSGNPWVRKRLACIGAGRIPAHPIPPPSGGRTGGGPERVHQGNGQENEQDRTQ